MFTVQKNADNSETAIAVGVIFPNDGETSIWEELDELRLLAGTAGAKVIDTVIQKRSEADSATYIGKGKAKELINQALEMDCRLIIFNDEITPTQLKNLQKIAGEDLKIIDRTGLILDIFTQHARTREAKTQVELAQLQYLLPRLTRLWTHLERQMGGIGTRGGPGETQIEIDRRLIKKQIAQLKSHLAKIEKQRTTRLQGRKDQYRVAIVGYTNAGKSTLMNVLTGADVLIKDQLFATLDTTTRKLEIRQGVKILLSDTVGFIHKLPHDLVASFKSTLQEAADANLLLKVIDASSPQYAEHLITINNVLKSIDLQDIPSICVFNKIDRIEDMKVLRQLRRDHPDAVFISALSKLKLDDLKNRILKYTDEEFVTETLKIPYNKSNLLDSVYSLMTVLEVFHDDNEMLVKVRAKRDRISSLKTRLK